MWPRNGIVANGVQRQSYKLLYVGSTPTFPTKGLWCMWTSIALVHKMYNLKTVRVRSGLPKMKTEKAWFELLENVHPMFILPYEKEFIKKNHENTKLGFPIIVEFRMGQGTSFSYEVLGFPREKMPE